MFGEQKWVMLDSCKFHLVYSLSFNMTKARQFTNDHDVCVFVEFRVTLPLQKQFKMRTIITSLITCS